MTRRRYNGLRAQLDGSHSSGTTTINFTAGLTHSNGVNVPTITGTDYIPLVILDTDGHLSEIVHLVAGTSPITSGTIVRAREGTAGVSHADGDGVVCAPTNADLYEANPASPSAFDDEFDGTSGVTWTSTPTAPSTYDVNTTVDNCGYVRSNGNTSKFIGKYHAIPGAYPFTITAKVFAFPKGNTNLGLGLFISETPVVAGSPIMFVGPIQSGGSRIIQRLSYNDFDTTSFVSSATSPTSGYVGPLYIRIIAASATSFTLQTSVNGQLWQTVVSAFNPGFTPGVMGFALSENGSADYDGAIEFFRVT